MVIMTRLVVKRREAGTSGTLFVGFYPLSADRLCCSSAVPRCRPPLPWRMTDGARGCHGDGGAWSPCRVLGTRVVSQLPAKRQVVDANAFDAYGPSHGWSGD